MRAKQIFGIGAVLLTSMAVGTYWDVLTGATPQAEGTPPPQTSSTAAKNSKIPTVKSPTTSPSPAEKPEILTLQTPIAVQVVNYHSELLGDRTYGVVLPPEYDQHPNKRYPVIFLLHGGHGVPTDWFKKGNALPVIQKLYAEHRLPPSIIITHDGNDKRGTSAYWDPQYLDGKNGQVLSAIGDELVQVIKSRYRTKDQPGYWAIGGLSSGGWGALNVGLHRSQTFQILFSHSGYFVDRSGAENSPLDYVKQLSADDRQKLHIYLDAGSGDGKYLVESREFHQELEALRVQNVFNEFPGGHGVSGAETGWHYWHHHLEDSLGFVGDRFRETEMMERVTAQRQNPAQTSNGFLKTLLGK